MYEYGSSAEVLEHHARLHIKECGSHPTSSLVCPCGDTVLLVCLGCGNCVYLASRTAVICEHGRAQMES